MDVGYLRVSTGGQSLDVQRETMKAHGVSTWYEEKLSGKDTNRPELQRCLAVLSSGDVLVVCKIDRLARSTVDLLTICRDLKAKGVLFKSLNAGEGWLDLSNSIGELILTILASVAQFERDRINERTEEGRRHAMKHGTKTGNRFGRPSTLTEDQEEQARQWLSEGVSQRTIAKRLGVSNATISRRVS